MATAYLSQLSEWRGDARVPTRVEVDCLAKVIMAGRVRPNREVNCGLARLGIRGGRRG